MFHIKKLRLILNIFFVNFYFYLVKVPSKHDKVVDLEEKVKDATRQHGLATSYSDKVKEKAEKLKNQLRKDLGLSESDYMEILSDVHECENELKNAKDNMQKSKTKFLEAHGTVLDILKVSSELEISVKDLTKKGRGNISVYFVQCNLINGS